MALQFAFGQIQQHALVAVERGSAVDLDLLQHILIEMLEQLFAGIDHLGIDFVGKLQLKLLKGGVDLLGFTAGLVYLFDAALQIDTALNGAKHFVGCTEDTVKQIEFLIQQLVNPAIRLVAQVDEVEHHHIVLLPVAMAATNALFDALGIPGQVVVDHQGAELQVDTFGCGFGGDHDAALATEVVHQCGAGICCSGAGNSVRTLMLFKPLPVDLPGLRIIIGAIEKHDTVLMLAVAQQRHQVVLGFAGLGEDDGLFIGTQFRQLVEADVQCL